MSFRLTVEIKKQNRKATNIGNLLGSLREIDGVMGVRFIEDPLKYEISGTFNPSDVYQKITSNGYYIKVQSKKPIK